MIGLILALMLSTTTQCPNPIRRQSVVERFRATHPAPLSCAAYRMTLYPDGTIKFEKYDSDALCEVDHICPLACCGLDSVDNMQWLDKKENRIKGSDCTKCPL
jgi:hypothetical protein